MDFNDTPEEAAFRAEARAWLEANADVRDPNELAESILGERETPEVVAVAKAWQAKKAEASWACLTWPKEYGGRSATAIRSVIWSQEEARVKTPPNIFTIGIGMVGPTILAHGSEEQKARWLPKLARGEEVWCQLFSEPNAGSDLAGLRSSAVRDGDEWVVNGQKTWTTGAQYSDWGILVARSDPSVVKHAGLTYFAVDMHSPGIEIRPIKQINGSRGFNEVFFTDVRIPDENRISGVGNGWAVAITTLMNERAAIGAGGRGDPFPDLLRLATEIELDGRPAIECSDVRQRLADFYVRSRGLRYSGYRILTALSHGQAPGPEASMSKLVGAALSQQMGAFGMELQGAAGSVTEEALASQEGAWQERYLVSPGLRIAGGTDEVLRNIIAERVLHLPPEMRLDKDVAFREIPKGPASK